MIRPRPEGTSRTHARDNRCRESPKLLARVYTKRGGKHRPQLIEIPEELRPSVSSEVRVTQTAPPRKTITLRVNGNLYRVDTNVPGSQGQTGSSSTTFVPYL